MLIKKVSLGVLIIAVLAMQIYFFASMRDRYIPTRFEWLSMEIVHSLRFTMDSWERRYGITPIIYKKEKTISVGITAANGETPISDAEGAMLLEFVKTRVKGIVEEYSWLKGYKVSVSIIGSGMLFDDGSGTSKKLGGTAP